MGCDIHTYVEILCDGKWARYALWPFSWRSYTLFGFLADVRNYSAIPAIAKPRGLPHNVSPFVAEEREVWGSDGHSDSWLSLQELLGFDYDQSVEDRRISKRISNYFWDGGCTAEPGDGLMTSYRELLGSEFFKDLAILQALGDPNNIRVVFWFDC